MTGLQRKPVNTKKQKSPGQMIPHQSAPLANSFFTRTTSISLMVGIIFSLLAYSFFYPSGSNPASQNTPITSDRSTYHPHAFQYTNETIRPNDPQFNNKTVNTLIIKAFENFIQVKLHERIHFDTGIQYDTPHLGLINDPDYCLKSDLLKLEHPEIVLENYYILTDFAHNELSREIVRDFGIDTMKNVNMASKTYRRSQINLNISLIHSRISRFHHFHVFGENLFCVFQTSNHVPGKWSITGKDLVIDNLRSYELKPFRNPENCKKTIRYMPKSFRLYDQKECSDFFQILKQQSYKDQIAEEGLVFIMKEGRDIHRGEGINLITKEFQSDLENQYQKGALCGKNVKVRQVQQYIINPLLYRDHKIEVRIYFYLASTNPLIIYSQNNAHLRRCGLPYSKTDIQRESHICNVAVSKHVTNNFVVDFPLEGLEDYLIETGKITKNSNWLNQKIYPQIYEAIIHLVRSGEHDFLKDSRVNENFAADFLIDDNHKIWLMENNPNPQILSISQARVQRHYRMFGDLFEIQFKYLRSRFSRLRKLALEMKTNIEAGNYDEKIYKPKFDQANKNFLEPEFQLREDNTYVKIYDGNLDDNQKFMDFVPEDCLYQD